MKRPQWLARPVSGVLAVALASSLLVAAPIEAETVQDFQAQVTRLQQAQPGLRQSLNGLQDATGKSPERITRWNRFVEDLSKSGGAIDPNALVQQVLRESYLASVEDLRFFAEKVRYFNAAKKALRDHIERLRAMAERLRASCGDIASSLRLSGLEQAMAQLDSVTPALQHVEGRLTQQASRFDGASRSGFGNLSGEKLLEALMALLKDAAREDQKANAYLIQELSKLNKVAESFAAEQKRFADASRSLSATERGTKGRCGAGGER